MIHATGVAADGRPRPFVSSHNRRDGGDEQFRAGVSPPTRFHGMHDDDRQMLIRTRRGDQAAARSLWHRHAPRLVAYAATIIRGTGTRDDAEDTVQAVFCRVMALDPREVGAVTDPGAWLAQLTRRTALNWIRGKRRERARVGRVADGMRSEGRGGRTRRPKRTRRDGASGGFAPCTPASGGAAARRGVDVRPDRDGDGREPQHRRGAYRVAVERLRVAFAAGIEGTGAGGSGAATGAAGGTSSHRQRMVQHV